jgi:hypothetical protein
MTGEAGQATPPRRLELVPDPADAFGAALTAGTRAREVDGDLRASRQSFERAYQLAERAGDAQAMALAVLGLSGLWVSERRTVTGAVLLESRLEHVLSLLDPHSSLALRVRTRLAGEADYVRGGHDSILAQLDVARTAADPELLAEALSLAHHCLLGPEHVALRRDLAVDLIKTSFRTRRRSDLLMGLLWQTVDAYLSGDPHAGRHLGELRDQLGQQNHLAVAFVVSAIDVMLAIRAGRLDDAESLSRACAANGAAAGDVDHEWWSGAQLVTIRWYQGRLTELLPVLRDREHSPDLSAVDNSAVAALAVAAAQAGDLRTAVSSLRALCGSDLAALPRSSSWLGTMNGIVETAALLGDAEVSARAYDLLRPYAGLPMVGSLGITCFGSVQHALGVASLTCGHLDQSVDHLRAAVQHNLALAHWPSVAASRRRLAEAYQRRGHPGDAEAARDELETIASQRATQRPPVLAEGDRDLAGLVAECHRVGRKWRLAWRQRSVLMEDSIGMTHLAVLVANPRREILAAELAAGLSALGTASDGGSAHPVLDQAAIAEYRNRLRRLDAELDQRGGGYAEARAERDWLVAQLASAAGLGGRVRSFPDQGERARVAVGKAIRRALARIAEADPVLGDHLRQTVHTGVRCSYWPG